MPADVSSAALETVDLVTDQTMRARTIHFNGRSGSIHTEQQFPHGGATDVAGAYEQDARYAGYLNSRETA